MISQGKLDYSTPADYYRTLIREGPHISYKAKNNKSNLHFIRYIINYNKFLFACK